MAATLINGRAYDFINIVFSILGVSMVSVTEITYDDEQEKTNNKGASVNPVSRGHGAKDPSGSVTLSMNDIEALRLISPTGSLLDIPAFDIVITYLNPENLVVNHILQFTEFTSDGGGGSDGDTDLTRSLSLVIGSIKYR